jgi:hypothetical protein
VTGGVGIDAEVLTGLVIVLRRPGGQHPGLSGIRIIDAGLRDLMARMGHDSERAAMICHHQARGADQAISSAIDALIEADRTDDGDDDDGTAGLVPVG